jgi:RNA polymerase sigma factor (sigma-70 family)
VQNREPQGDVDAELIRRFLGGDEAAFRSLYNRHTPRLRMIICRLLGQRYDEADDVLQETWIAGSRGLHRYNGNGTFASWLTTIGIRLAQRRFARQQENQEPDDIASSQNDEPLTAIDLERAIAQLPDHQRAVVVLHDIEGLTHEQIALQLGIAVGTSKVTLSRAREALRHMLNDGVSHVR